MMGNVDATEQQRHQRSLLSVIMIGILIHHCCQHCLCEVLDMKVVDEPSSFGSSYVYSQVNHNDQSTLKLRVQPANFSGPPHFRRLVGRCYSAVITGYKYNFCPFSNVTQHEQGIHWNPYNGVLGVWQEWEVINNTFIAMMMRDGESCGNIFRSVKVTFECGNTSKILNVSEPETCKYHLEFLTPLVCHPEALLVYPTLSRDLQLQWDVVETEMERGELTEKGYKKRLVQVFEKAGIYLTEKHHTHLLKKAEEAKEEKMKEGEFESLETCKIEFRRLQEQVKTLIGQLRVGAKSAGPDDYENHDNSMEVEDAG